MFDLVERLLADELDPVDEESRGRFDVKLRRGVVMLFLTAS